MTGAGCKHRGNRFERMVAELLRGYGWRAKRTPLSGAIAGWKQDVTTDCPLHLECKNVESVGKQFLDWYKKAAGECGTKPPTIVWTRNGEQIYAFLLFTDLLTMVKRAELEGMIQMPKWKKPDPKKKVDLSEGLPFAKSKFLHELPATK